MQTSSALPSTDLVCAPLTASLLVKNQVLHQPFIAVICSGIKVSPEILSEFMSFMATSLDPRYITFTEFRNFLLLLPRRASPDEIYRYYEVSRFMGYNGCGPARITMDGQ